jgi:hypothetical protein
MLERDGVLLTWSLAQLPAEWRSAPASGLVAVAEKLIAAQKLADHRLAYLEYEGPLTDNRGEVARHDEGDYEVLDERPTSLRLELIGRNTRCRAALQQVEGDSWTLRVEDCHRG